MTTQTGAELVNELARRVCAGDSAGTVDLIQRGLARGLDPSCVLHQGLLPAMDEVGLGFQAGDLFIPEVVVAARAMQAGIDVLKPLLARGAAASAGRVVLGTVKGDLHDIGKKLVGIMLQGAGFEIVDLGIDVAPERFVEAVKQEQAQILGMSALLSTTMPMMRVTIEALQRAGLSGRVHVLVGGAPVSAAWAQEIGAEGYAPDAVTAVRVAKQLVGQEAANA